MHQGAIENRGHSLQELLLGRLIVGQRVEQQHNRRLGIAQSVLGCPGRLDSGPSSVCQRRMPVGDGEVGCRGDHCHQSHHQAQRERSHEAPPPRGCTTGVGFVGGDTDSLPEAQRDGSILARGPGATGPGLAARAASMRRTSNV